MIVINVTIDSSAEAITALTATIAEMEQASRAEDGCEDYTFSVELNAPHRVRVTERWRDEAALRAHFASEHMATFNAAMAAHPPAKVDVKCYDAKEIPLPRAS